MYRSSKCSAVLLLLRNKFIADGALEPAMHHGLRGICIQSSPCIAVLISTLLYLGLCASKRLCQHAV